MESLGLNLKSKTAGPSPELRANVFSYLTWTWVLPFINKGNKQPIQTEDLYDLIPAETTESCELSWETRRSTLRNPSVWKLVLLAGHRDLFYSLLCCPPWLVAVVSQVFIVRFVVQHVERTHEKFQKLLWWKGVVLISALMLASIVQSLTLLWNFTFAQKAGMKIKAAVSMVVFNKLLKLRLVALGGTSNGEMMNLISNDTQKFLDGAYFATFTIFGIFGALVVCGIVVVEVGVSALPGVGIIILAQVVQIFTAQGVGSIRKHAVKFTDARVRKIAEILSGIRVVKYNGWTTTFIKRIHDVRALELQWIRKSAFLRASTSTIKDSIAPLGALVTIWTYVALHNGILSASKAFTIIGLYSVLVRIFSVSPTGIQFMWESYVGIQRLQRFMDLPNGIGGISPEDLDKQHKLYPNVDVAIIDGTFSWYLKGKDFGASYQCARPSISRIKTEVVGDNPKKQDSQHVEASSSFLEPLDDEKCRTLKGVNLLVEKGEMIAIIGPVGSGKTSLLLALLGEMECINGAFWTKRMVSYAPQQPWILNDTIRNNIVCSSEFDEARYNQVLFCCALNYDIQQLPAADETEIGERGVNLSGGQKARISLARACYSASPILFLDDPLAAVDVPTAKHLMEHIIGGILKGRSVILVTHNKSSLELVNKVFLMKNGRLQEVQVGAKNEIIQEKLMEKFNEKEQNLDDKPNKKETSHLTSSRESIDNIQDEEKACSLDYGRNHMSINNGEAFEVDNKAHVILDSEKKQGYNSESIQCNLGKGLSRQSGSIQMLERKSLVLHIEEAKKSSSQATGALTLKEDRVLGEVKWKTYWNYLLEGGLIFFVFVLTLMCFAQAERIMVDYWIAVWVNDKYHLTKNLYLMSYAILVVGYVFLSLLRGLLFTEATIRAANHMHTRMCEKILRSPQLFFDQNPVGRILNRFGKDQSMVDELLPYTTQTMLEYMVGIMGVMIFITMILPWFLIIMPPFLALIWHFRHKYVVVSRELKRIDGITRSSIFAHFAQTLQGLSSIRALGMEAILHNHFRELIDENHRCFIIFLHINRWVGSRFDFCASICVSITTLLTVLLREKISPGVIGVVLIQSLQLTSYLQYGIRLIADTENLFTSVERIQAYENLPTEANPNSPPELISKHWPERGEIEFKNFTMAYQVDLHPVLNNLSFKVLSKEKVGILGRTGVGKSSLVAGLFRMVENAACSGSILVDGVDLKLVGLDDIRKRLSIIPQDPMLFRGTIRLNLDPFELHSDIELYEALGKVQILKKIKSLKDGLGSLVEDNGDNFSVGERQLLCLARSLLRRSKIIVLDEATAAVDEETDQLIQQTIRSVFKDCTVLTIAHRIETIIDCHRVLVLTKKGQISEFDTPTNLLRLAEEENLSKETMICDWSKHVFASMVAQAGPKIAKKLKEVAELAEKERQNNMEYSTPIES